MDQPTYPIPKPTSPPTGGDDRHAMFLALFLASEKEVFRYISALVPYLNDTQDLLQQTALALWRRFDAYDPSQPFTPWACRFALLEVKDFLRHNRKWHVLLESDLADELVRRREALAADMDRRFAHLAGCLEKLPSRQRAVVEGYYYQRQPIEGLAVATGKTVDAIYKSLQRIRQALFDCVTASMHHEETQT